MSADIVGQGGVAVGVGLRKVVGVDQPFGNGGHGDLPIGCGVDIAVPVTPERQRLRRVDRGFGVDDQHMPGFGRAITAVSFPAFAWLVGPPAYRYRQEVTAHAAPLSVSDRPADSSPAT